MTVKNKKDNSGWSVLFGLLLLIGIIKYIGYRMDQVKKERDLMCADWYAFVKEPLKFTPDEMNIAFNKCKGN